VELAVDNALEVAPPKAECPVCHAECKRHSIARRKVRDISLDGERIIPIRVGVYSCLNCDKHFRLQTGLAEKGKHYSKRALEKGFVAIRDDKNTFTALPNRLARDFHIEPSKSTCHRWFHEKAASIDFEKEYEPQAVQSFSGALAIDEVYDGEFCLFFATDPLNRKPVSFHLCQSGGAKELEVFLLHLRAIGITPEVLIVDGSNLYYSVPKKVWPNVKIQLCIFHVIRNCQDDLLDGIRAYHRSLPKGASWRGNFDPPPWWTFSVEQKARERDRIKDFRYAFTTRSENLAPQQLKVLEDLCEKHPTLKTIREFQQELMVLFVRNQTKVQARHRFLSMVMNDEYRANIHIRAALKRLSRGKFEKMIEFLDYENLDYTTNHVERTNRWFRKRQKTHYRNRLDRTIRNMLKADLMRWSEDPSSPVRLQKRGDDQKEHAA
jgi:hypothetical protein